MSGKKKWIWTIDECYYCRGENKKCEFCEGRGKIFVQQCPRVVAKDFGLLPFFIAYRNSNGLVWPDGRGRLYQPIKLVNVFDLWEYYWNKFEPEHLKKLVDNAKKT